MPQGRRREEKGGSDWEEGGEKGRERERKRERERGSGRRGKESVEVGVIERER